MAFHVCIEKEQLPDFIHFEDDGKLYIEVAGPDPKCRPWLLLGLWEEDKKLTASSLQYATVEFNDLQSAACFTRVVAEYGHQITMAAKATKGCDAETKGECTRHCSCFDCPDWSDR